MIIAFLLIVFKFDQGKRFWPIVDMAQLKVLTLTINSILFNIYITHLIFGFLR